MPPSPLSSDVHSLLESSQPRAGRIGLGYAVGLFALIVLVATLVGSQSSEMQALVRLISMLLLLGVMVAMGLYVAHNVRLHRGEQQRLEAAEELVMLRRWSEAAVVLQDLLSRPTRSQQTRLQGLLLLATVLARYERFEDAIQIQDYLLNETEPDELTTRGLRMSRAMAMLRSDHLFDADRAISELRRELRDAESGGLALVEMYRDVKTGHPAEAVELFENALPQMRDQLGHRVADGYALAAKAYDLMGQESEAARAYERATLLAPPVELQRRYPELADVIAKYQPAPVPAEAA